jgi:hypothetical protein
MWTLTPDDTYRAKDELLQRRMAAEARHAEELQTIDAELAEIAVIEQAIEAFARKYKPAALSDEGEEEELATKLATQATLTPSSRNWGDARFTPAASAQGDAA